MNKKIKKILLGLTFCVCILGVSGPVARAAEKNGMVEGRYGSINYIGRVGLSPLYAWTKQSTSVQASLQGVISGRLQAFLGIPCSHTFEKSFVAVKATYNEGIYYVDEQHTIANASFTWKINGAVVDQYTMAADPY